MNGSRTSGSHQRSSRARLVGIRVLARRHVIPRPTGHRHGRGPVPAGVLRKGHVQHHLPAAKLDHHVPVHIHQPPGGTTAATWAP